MLGKLEQTDRETFETVVAGLESAWNAGDGTAFAAAFSGDADFVNVYGMRGKGRAEIAAGHDRIFRTVYAGSRMSYRVRQARPLADGVALVHIAAHLRIPEGPLAGERQAFASALFRRERTGWKIAAFHNTFVQAPPVDLDVFAAQPRGDGAVLAGARV